MQSIAQRNLASTVELMEQKSNEADEILKKAEDEGRDPTEAESKRITELLGESKALNEKKSEYQTLVDQEQEIHALSGRKREEVSITDVEVKSPSASEIKSLGDQFLESKGYKELIVDGSPKWDGDGWKRLAELDTKAVLYETVGTALTPREYQPGVVSTLFQPNYLGDLIPNVQTSAAQVTYVTETTATNAAAAVAEGTAKPQSTLAFGETTETVRKIATILPVSEEMLADAPQIQAYINSRLMLFVKNTEEAQLLTGSGTSPNLSGFIASPRTSIGTYFKTSTISNERAILNAMTGARGSSFLNPDCIIMHPNNWLTIRAGTDANGQYYGGGPFYGPYGGPQGPSGVNYFDADNLWGVRVLVTSNIPAGTALVGAFQTGAAIYRRQGVTVDATNSHSTWFADNITAIRAEERLALAVYRQSAFSVVGSLA